MAASANDTSPSQALLLFACNQELYETFHTLSDLLDIEETIKHRPKLFVLYHVTNLKYLIHQHCKRPNDNILSTHLDSMLQSLYNLLPKYQPNDIQSAHDVTSSAKQNMAQLLDTSYSSLFYKLHQELKIQSILTCNEPQHLKTTLINNNFKLNPHRFDFRHLDIQKDIEENSDIEFEIIDIIETLGCLTKKTSKQNPEKVEQFVQLHEFSTFKAQLFEYINAIKSLFCSSMTDLIYDASEALASNQRENAQKQHNKPIPPEIEPVQRQPANSNNNEAKSVNDHLSPKVDKTPTYKTGMKVKIRQNSGDKNKNCKDPYIWKTAKIIQMNKHRITVKMLDGDHHRVIRDFEKIKPILEVDSDENDSSSDEDDDITMLDKNDEAQTKKRPKRNTNLSVQSANYQRGRRFWEKHEDIALQKGLIKYKDIIDVKTRGVPGIWSKIKADDDEKDEDEKQLKHRTTKMLYDRYRTFVKKGMVPKECQKTA